VTQLTHIFSAVHFLPPLPIRSECDDYISSSKKATGQTTRALLSELIRTLIHSQSHFCDLQLYICGGGLDAIQAAVRLDIVSCNFFLSKESQGKKENVTTLLETAMDEPTAFSGGGGANISHIQPWYKRTF